VPVHAAAWENVVASFVEPHRPAPAPEPTPIHKTDAFRLSRPASAGEVPLPEIQPSDIEEIPGYELLGVLGRGGMGMVFRARQISLKRQVALKMILTGRHARSVDRLRFQKEAEAVARLQHANIVQIYEVGQQNGLPYISLEFVNAGSLAQFLGGIPQAPSVSAQLVRQLAGAMHYAHKRGIIHRDLKPANILLHLDESRILRDGQSADTAVFRELTSYVPKISDFGLAKHGGDEHLRHGTIVGTPSYMAPEQAGRAGGVGPAADVYALGAILYEMLTGRPPFKATTVQETALQVLDQDPVPPTQLQPKIPRDLETICLTCLQKDAAARYASAEALGEDLRRFLHDEPILAHPTPLSDRLVKWAHRRPAAAMALVAGALMATGLFHAWGQLTYSLRGERDLARAECEQSAAHLQDALVTIDQLSGEHGPERRRQALVKTAAFYEALAENSRCQPGQRAVTAHACQRLGELRHELGDSAGATAALAEAIALLEQLTREAPNHVDFTRRLRECREQRRTISAPR
jgi:serine/threonine protein kinase